ncbi:MAG: hypothetical protein U9Q67_00615, partial [Patescibacteria group bacterium]|nr:hypothetical protein [Patescibacteria group bacterium]
EFDKTLTGCVDPFLVTDLLRACHSPRAGNKYVNMSYNRDSAQKAYAEFLEPITPQVEAYKELDREGMISRDRAARILLNMHRWTLTEEQMEGDNPGFLSPTADKASDVLKELWRLCESTLGVTVRKSTTPDDINIVHAIDYFVGRILSVTDIEGRANALLYVIDNMQNEENSAQVEFLQDVLGLMVVR